MQTMEAVIPLRLARPLPALLTRKLCGAGTARDIGIDGCAGWPARTLFALVLGAVRAFDAVARLLARECSLARLAMRVLGYRFMTDVLMNETRPLKLPPPVLAGVSTALAGRGVSPNAPRWLNALERRLTTPAPWRPSVRQPE